MIDLFLILGYLLAVKFTRLAIMPAVAFLLTALISFAVISMIIQHILFILVYLCCALFSSTKIAYAMLASSVVNLASVGYFLSDIYLVKYSTYFAVSMTVINLCILFTIVRSDKNGDHSKIGGLVFARISNIFNLQTHTKTGARR
jgi:hypothetical protein